MKYKSILNLTLFIVPMAFLSSCASTSGGSSNRASSPSGYNQFNYDVTCDFVGKEGTQAIVISSVQRKPEDALALARIQAVHAIVYKGINSDQCKVPPLVDRDTYAEYQPYFDSLFSSGEFMKYVVNASDAPIDLFYMGKSVKVFSDVSVDRNALRKQLINDGIIKGLGDIF